MRSWRKLIEFRQNLLARRVSIKNQVRSVLRANVLAAPGGLWTKKGLAWLAEGSLPAAEKLAVEMEVEELNEVNERIKRVESELAKISSKHPGVALLTRPW